MADGGLTNKQTKSPKGKMNDPNANPSLQKQLECMLEVLTRPHPTQEEQDRRWRNMCAYIDQLPEDQKPITMGGHRDVLSKFGMILAKKMTKAEAAKPGHSGDFMQTHGELGMNMVESYEMEGQQDAKPSCDHCKKVGATKRCKQCGEWHCSRECQKAGWPDHKRPCKLVATERLYGQILDLA